MTGIINALLAAPPVLLLALMLYTIVDRDQVEQSVERKLNEWENS